MFHVSVKYHSLEQEHPLTARQGHSGTAKVALGSFSSFPSATPYRSLQTLIPTAVHGIHHGSGDTGHHDRKATAPSGSYRSYREAKTKNPFRQGSQLHQKCSNSPPALPHETNSHSPE